MANPSPSQTSPSAGAPQPIPAGPGPYAISPWGAALFGGFQRLPDALLKHQFRLELSPLDLAIVLNIALHYWAPGNLPHPTISLVAKRIGVSRRSVERRLEILESRNLVMRMHFEVSDKGKKIRRFDLSGLIAAVENYARREPSYEARRARYSGTKVLAVADSKSATGLTPDIFPTPEWLTESNRSAKRGKVSPTTASKANPRG